MVKLRDARYCNLKLLLIFLVVYGHLIEPGIWQSKILMIQYKGIYLFHMPLFCFLSGVFLTDSQSCRRQVAKTFSLYIFLQTMVVFFDNGNIKPLTPYWHLWYLLSYSVWASLGWLWFRFCKGKGKLLILICTILIGCLAGLHPNIGRELSLSRTLVFLPYFWMGLICDPRFPWERLQLLSLAGLGIAIAIIACWGNQISVTFLYQAAPYGKLENGMVLRLICYLTGTLLGLFCLSFTPIKRFPFTKAGADTMPAYLIHAPIALYVRNMGIPWPYYLPVAAAILYAVYKLLRWHSGLYGIVPTQRRESRCLHFKKSMKNTRSRSTDSCYP